MKCKIHFCTDRSAVPWTKRYILLCSPVFFLCSSCEICKKNTYQSLYCIIISVYFGIYSGLMVAMYCAVRCNDWKVKFEKLQPSRPITFIKVTPFVMYFCRKNDEYNFGR